MFNQIEGELQILDEDSTIKWLFVAGHYPIYTAGGHGEYEEGSAVIVLRDRLLPMLKEYRVDCYISGHDHLLEHISSEEGDMDFVVSGSGAKLDVVEYRTIQDVTIKYASSNPGFTQHEIKGDSMWVHCMGFDLVTPGDEDSETLGNYRNLYNYQRYSKRSGISNDEGGGDVEPEIACGSNCGKPKSHSGIAVVGVLLPVLVSVMMIGFYVLGSKLNNYKDGNDKVIEGIEIKKIKEDEKNPFVEISSKAGKKFEMNMV
ncbi:hypothetical protein TrLO_g2567 [Triparma laevis f. longispina]|nr:hypothetical protein TrLO_g2567 [Triparma laevis f. longispina]